MVFEPLCRATLRICPGAVTTSRGPFCAKVRPVDQASKPTSLPRRPRSAGLPVDQTFAPQAPGDRWSTNRLRPTRRFPTDRWISCASI